MARHEDDQSMSLLVGQRRLCVVWISMTLMAAAVVGYETILVNRFIGHDIDYRPLLVRWFLPTVCPTAGLMLGVLGSLELQPEARTAARRRRVTTFFFRLTFAMSIAYLSVIVVLPLIAGGKDSAKDAADVLAAAENLLAAFQGLVAIVIGVFFVSGKEAAHD